MTFYKDMQLIATDILSNPDFDQGSIKLIKKTSGAGSPDAPGSPTITEYDLQGVCKGISFKYSKMGFDTKTDFEVIAAVLDGVEIGINDLLEINGQDYKIIEDMSTPSAGVKVVWKFIARKGG